MNRPSATTAPAVITTQVLIAPAIADLERARPQSYNGEIVSLEASHWRDRFIKTTAYGWLRLPD